jgi:hypothetical protein
MPSPPLAALDPFAQPDRRWDLAFRLAADRRRLRREHRADPPLLAAVAHLRGRQDADIAAALRLYESNGVPRWAVEAWLLAGLVDAEVTRRTGLAPAVVAAYEGLFWAVRRRRGCTDWLLLRCVGPAAWRGFRRDEVRQLWAYAAIAGGPLLVDLLIAPVLRTGTVKPMLDAYQEHGIDPRLSRWVAAQAEPVAGVEPTAEIEALRDLVGVVKAEPVVVAVGAGVAGPPVEDHGVVGTGFGSHLERLAAGLRAVRSAAPTVPVVSAAGSRAGAAGRPRAAGTSALRRRLAAVG